MEGSQTFWLSLWLSSMIITNHHPILSLTFFHDNHQSWKKVRHDGSLSDFSDIHDITNHHPDNSVPTYHHLTLTQQLLGCSLPMRFSIDRSMMIFATVTITIMIISITTMIMMILSASWQWSWWLSASWQWLWWWKLSHFSSTITLIQRTPGNPERFSMSHFPTRMFMSWWWRIWPNVWTEKSWNEQQLF